jgi:hypothetical protein
VNNAPYEVRTRGGALVADPPATAERSAVAGAFYVASDTTFVVEKSRFTLLDRPTCSARRAGHRRLYW